MNQIDIYMHLRIIKHQTPNITYDHLLSILKGLLNIRDLPKYEEHNIITTSDIQRLLQEKMSRRREVFWLRNHGFSQKFIAQFMQISQPAISYNLHSKGTTHASKISWCSPTITAIIERCKTYNIRYTNNENYTYNFDNTQEN